MVRSAPTGAGASAHARYRRELAEGRGPRVLLRVLLALLLAVPVGLLLDWRAGLAVALAVVLVDAVRHWRTHEAVRTWRRGALGERRTARRLQLLASLGYAVLHDRALPRGRANVDHLVIGPAGVFLIDSKQWRRPRTGGRRERTVTPDDARSLLYETQIVARTLSTAYGARVDVTPVLAIHGAHVPRRGLSVSGAYVLRPSLLSTWVLQQGQRLDSRAVARLQELAGRAFPPYVQT
ncbi:nuclease-related domain-containing protein [Planomonospora sp. ID82291]|uniref:nuclease-related domain-containing protein n=1 Tax=Planomonospora sp. ID82291 TaxID=2738136 RepID=UPI0018C37819|nr:nuclease-related domain-containing protein [Planomonospora sp. ID82291]MBG0819122.1 NERD domain-containing protein [Planomonospora sp. ID82291]